jgi:hypothetical protein
VRPRPLRTSNPATPSVWERATRGADAIAVVRFEAASGGGAADGLPRSDFEQHGGSLAETRVGAHGHGHGPVRSPAPGSKLTGRMWASENLLCPSVYTVLIKKETFINRGSVNSRCPACSG